MLCSHQAKTCLDSNLPLQIIPPAAPVSNQASYDTEALEAALREKEEEVRLTGEGNSFVKHRFYGIAINTTIFTVLAPCPEELIVKGFLSSYSTNSCGNQTYTETSRACKKNDNSEESKRYALPVDLVVEGCSMVNVRAVGVRAP